MEPGSYRFRCGFRWRWSATGRIWIGIVADMGGMLCRGRDAEAIRFSVASQLHRPRHIDAVEWYLQPSWLPPQLIRVEDFNPWEKTLGKKPVLERRTKKGRWKPVKRIKVPMLRGQGSVYYD